MKNVDLGRAQDCLTLSLLSPRGTGGDRTDERVILPEQVFSPRPSPSAGYVFSVVSGVPPDVEGEHPAARTWSSPSPVPCEGSRAFRRVRGLNNIKDEPLRGCPGPTAGETHAATAPNTDSAWGEGEIVKLDAAVGRILLEDHIPLKPCLGRPFLISNF
jgi:hypothetical protein